MTVQVLFLLASYTLISLIFWVFQTMIRDALRVINLAIKSPKNRKEIEAHQESVSISRNLSILWPLVVLLKMRDGLRKKK
jgi:hypothetical protein